MTNDRSKGPIGRVPDNPAPFEPFGVASSERIYHSPWCGLRRDMVRLKNGAEREYHVFEIGDAVAVVPVLPDGRIVLIGQYRYPHGKTHWEIPAGRLHDDEEPLLAAQRELREETGYRARRFEPLPGFYPSNGITAHFAHAFVALECEKVFELELDDTEQLVVQVFTRDEVANLLDAGRIEDAFAAISLMYWLRRSTP
ncbi:MAG: NUDIX hydrolase [Planctomycetota bacterium]|nr:NUDIX hydrolase [Planctomycetota bacterium]